MTTSQNIIQPPGADEARFGYQAIRQEMGPYYPRFSVEEFSRRQEIFKSKMVAADVDAVIAYAGGFNLGNQKAINYLTNVVHPQNCYLVFPLEAEPTLYMLAYSMIPTALACAVIEDVRWATGIRGPIERLKELGLDKNRHRIGIVGEDPNVASIPHDHYEYLAEAFPNITFVNLTKAMHDVMKIPSTEELDWYRIGARYSDLGVEAYVKTAAPGVTDSEVYAAVHQSYLSQPGGFFYFMWLGSSPMASPYCPYPFGLPSHRTLQQGDAILSEISGSYHGYAGQIIRPIILGKPTDLYRKLFDIAKETYEAIQPVLKPGNTPRDVLSISQRFLDHGLTIQCPAIHGWGQRLIPPLADLPGSNVWAASLDEPFVENQLLVIEPNPCTPDLRAGIFLGDLNRVTQNGGESLHQYPLELIVKD